MKSPPPLCNSLEIDVTQLQAGIANRLWRALLAFPNAMTTPSVSIDGVDSTLILCWSHRPFTVVVEISSEIANSNRVEVWMNESRKDYSFQRDYWCETFKCIGAIIPPQLVTCLTEKFAKLR